MTDTKKPEDKKDHTGKEDCPTCVEVGQKDCKPLTYEQVDKEEAKQK